MFSIWYVVNNAFPFDGRGVISPDELVLILCDHINGLTCDIKKLIQYDQLNDQNISDIRQNLKSIEMDVAGLAHLTTDFENFKNEMTARQDGFEQKIDGNITRRFIDMDKNITLSFNAQNAHITTFEIQTKTDIENWKNSTIQNFGSIVNGLTDDLQKVNTRLDTDLVNISDYLKTYIDEIFGYKNIYYVVNPVTGQVQDIDTVLEFLYDVTTNALTVQEYDELKLTVDEYENLHYTAIEYLSRIRWLWQKWYIEKLNTITSPFTGLPDTVANVVSRLVNIPCVKCDALTVDQYDALNITVQEYEQKNVDVFNYDWHSKSIFSE